MSLTNPFETPAVERAGPYLVPQPKACEKAQAFEPHPPHDWNKRPDRPLHCDGILPVDEQPPCQAYISIEQPACGEPAPASVRVKTATTDAIVKLCTYHKRRHDNLAATRRTAIADQQRRAS